MSGGYSGEDQFFLDEEGPVAEWEAVEWSMSERKLDKFQKVKAGEVRLAHIALAKNIFALCQPNRERDEAIKCLMTSMRHALGSIEMEL